MSKSDVQRSIAASRVVDIVFSHFQAVGIIKDGVRDVQEGMALFEASQSIEHLVLIPDNER